MFRVPAAAAAIFGHSQLVGGVDLVLFRSVILRFTYRADEGDILTRSFFGHVDIITKIVPQWRNDFCVYAQTYRAG